MSTRSTSSVPWIYVLLAGLLVGYFGRPLIDRDEPSFRDVLPIESPEPVVEPVTPPACQRAVRAADTIITSQAQELVDEAERVIDVAQDAFELGGENDEEEFIGGLMRMSADHVEFARVLAQEADNYGWASERILRGNDAKVCLGIEE